MGGGLRGLSSDSNALLASKFREDRSTGQTPQKRAWKMPGRWNLVPANREDAIEAGRKVTDTLLSSSVTASDDMLSSEAEAEAGVKPSSEAEEAHAELTPPSADASIEEVPAEAAPTPVEAPEVAPRTRPLRELPFGGHNLPPSTSNDELVAAIKPLPESGLPKSRSAKNKLVATALPISKRARS